MNKWILVLVIAAIPVTLVLVTLHLANDQYFTTHAISIATGGADGTYHKIGHGFARLFAQDSRLRVALDEKGFDASGKPSGSEPPSEGAIENLDLLEKGEIETGLVQGGLPRRPGVYFLMNLFQGSVQVVARRGLVNRAGEPVTEIEHLDESMRISIGLPRSGTRFLALKILKFYQKDVILERPKDGDPAKFVYPLNVHTLGFKDSLLALKKDSSDPDAIDIAFFVSGTGTVDAIKKLLYKTDANGDLLDAEGRPLAIDPTVRLEEHEGIQPELMKVPQVEGEEDIGKTRPRFRFLQIQRNRGLCVAYNYLHAFDIPKGTYSSLFSFPEKDVATVSVYEMLCSSERAKPEWLELNLLCDAIWKKKALLEEVPQIALTTEEEAREAIEYEPHPAAVDFFNHQDRLPWPLILASTSAILTVFGSLTKVRMWIFRWRMLREMRWVVSIEDQIPTANHEELIDWLARLERIHQTLTSDFCKIRVGIGQGVGIVFDRVRLIRDRVRTRLAELAKANPASR